ncbi:MAG: sugar phosphorylase [Rubripirellula sp.]|nr:sugar phosphorylase [Rubripirellula sp.]
MDKQIQDLIHSIFGALPEELIGGIQRLLDGRDRELANDEDLWTEKDVVLITYADQICSSNASPLQTQQEFLLDHRLNKLISCVHLLPFCPYTSDDGFSVVDYLAVDQASGSWSDIEQLGQSFDLMFDLVLNHASQKSEWFQRFLAGDPEYNEFFIEMDSKADLSKVVRPRSLPLLTEFSSDAGSKHVWTTFSADQVDLNYANPRVMMRMLEILVEYARRGARVIRLDAIAFLWKELGTTCLHLPQTHAAVKLMRRVVDLVVPGTLLLTETNVPHAENLSYFGDGSDEAHMVYQFSLPPLIMDAVHSHDTSILKNWLSELQPPNVKTTFFNFTASHDGIGVRPLEGIVPEHRIQELVEIVRQRGGMVNTRQVSGVGDRPYELNLTYLSAVTGDDSEGVTRRVKRFLATQALMLSMQGIPAVYFHSLVGSPNDYEGVRTSGQNRRINRHKYDRGELDLALSDFNGVQRRVFDGYCRLLEVRKRQPAFHPSASQEVIDLPTNGLIGLRRVAKGGETLVSLVNLSGQATAIGCDLIGRGTYFDEISEERIYSQQSIEMSPYQVRWLTAE